MLCVLTRWLDRLIFFGFQVEHKPLAKIGLAGYLSRNPNDDAVSISNYNSIFTVAKIESIRCALGYDQSNFNRGPVINHPRQDHQMKTQHANIQSQTRRQGASFMRL